MELSSRLVTDIARLAKGDPEPPRPRTLYGTVMEHGGRRYVRVDGSDQLTPVETTVNLRPGDRVVVTIADHRATVTGNVSSPAAGQGDIDDAKQEIGSKITEVEVLIADKVSTKELDAERARIDELVADNVTVKGELSAQSADIGELKADSAEIAGKLTAQSAEIDSLKATKLDVKVAEMEYAKVGELEATDADIHNLRGDYADFKELATGRLTAQDAEIKRLDAEKVSADELDAKYADVDFANITEAAVEKLFADSGIIKDLVIEGGHVTGELVGVTIRGDLIEGGTVKADKLVVLGEDGLYYKINASAEKVAAQQTEYNSLDGSVITAKSITADRVSVTDLVAFGATVGGWRIERESIHTGVKDSPTAPSEGAYLGADGQLSLGGEESYVRYSDGPDGAGRVLDVSADFVRLKAGGSLSEALSGAESAQQAAEEAAAELSVLSDSIATLVTDADGGSLMEQTADGWRFNIGGILESVDEAAKGAEEAAGRLDAVESLAESAGGLAADVAAKTAFINMTTDGSGAPLMELGSQDSEFRVRITNTSIDFMQGSQRIAYITNQQLYIQSSVVTDELTVGEDGSGWVWKRRSNGNMGLRYT